MKKAKVQQSTSGASLAVLENGLRVVMVPCEAESVAAGIFVASGSRHETAKTSGISHFIEHMLFKGTPTRRPLDITRAIEGRGGNFNAMTGEESTCYYAHMPDEYLGEAVDILSDMYLRATIPEDEFEREKGVVIEEIKMYEDEPDSVAMENLQRSLFPKSMLGSPVAGSAKSLLPMKPGDLRRYIRSHYRADNTVVVVVGRFDAAEAVRVVADAFGPLRAARSRPPKPAREDFGRVVPLVAKSKDVQQAQLALGYRTFGIGDRRRYAASVMDAVLGRGMSSRLFQEVREKRGLSYDISSRMAFFRDAGMFTVTAGLDAAKADKALATVDRELGRICERGVSAAELARIKEFMVGNFRLSHEKVTSRLFFYGSTMLSFGRLVSPSEQVDGIKAVTRDDVQSVARAILRDGVRSVSWVVPR
jgi:predicted Zn-dependent peptidase